MSISFGRDGRFQHFCTELTEVERKGLKVEVKSEQLRCDWKLGWPSDANADVDVDGVTEYSGRPFLLRNKIIVGQNRYSQQFPVSVFPVLPIPVSVSVLGSIPGSRPVFALYF
jgi:hypothetical protein